MRSLPQCLLDVNLVRLRAIAHFWDVELTTNRQREVASQLAEAMVRPEAVADAWDVLPDDQRQALGMLLAAGGRMPFRIFTREWGEIRTMGPGRMERERPWQEPVSPAEGLWYRGLIFRAFDQGFEGTYEVVFVPPELGAHLPSSPVSLPVIALEPVSEPAAVCVSDDAFLDDVCTLLSYLQNERLRPTPDGGWPPRHEDRLIRRLRDPDRTRLSLLRRLVHGLEWLRLTDSGHLRPDPGPVVSWLRSSTAEQRGMLFEAWRDDSAWDDLFHVPTIHPEDTGAWHNDPIVARQAILRHLKMCDPSTWYAIDDFVAAVKEVDPDFQRPDGDYASWYIRDGATGAYLSGFESWDAVEGALIRFLIAGPLAWLGVVDLGQGMRDGPPIAFRLTQAGTAAFGLTTITPESEPGPLALRPDFTVLVPPAGRYERFQLARVADWVHAGEFYIYRLSPTSLDRARQQGIPLARVLEFLGRTTGAPVPRFIEAALTRWEARGGEVQIKRSVLLRLPSEELMAQVVSSSRIRHLIEEQVGPTAAVVREQDWPRLVIALGEMGLLPEVAGLDGGED